MKPTILTLAFFLCALSFLHAQNPPKGFEKVDQEIVITAVRTQMKYDVPAFNVKPESRVKLTFKNPDDLPHNLIICTPGKSKGKDKGGELIEAVLELGAKGEDDELGAQGASSYSSQLRDGSTKEGISNMVQGSQGRRSLPLRLHIPRALHPDEWYDESLQ